jgi:isoquinoline 1-oxidoreductase alpha subunit
MTRYRLLINGDTHNVDAPEDIPLLWLLRDHLDLPGTKFGCGRGLCGACTVLVEGVPTRSCRLSASARGERRVTTIEGLAASARDDGRGTTAGDLHPCQQAWIDEDVPQCGYCQAGQIVAAAALLARNPRPDDPAIDAAMRGHLCRCGTYTRIRRAIHRAAALSRGERPADAGDAAAGQHR